MLAHLNTFTVDSPLRKNIVMNSDQILHFTSMELESKLSYLVPELMNSGPKGTYHLLCTYHRFLDDISKKAKNTKILSLDPSSAFLVKLKFYRSIHLLIILIS